MCELYETESACPDKRLKIHNTVSAFGNTVSYKAMLEKETTYFT